MQNAKVQNRKRSRRKIPPLPSRAMGPEAERYLQVAFLLILAFCILHFAFCIPSLRADIQQPPKNGSRGERQLQKRIAVPPSPVAATVRVQPGGSVEIVLRANGALDKPIGFLLRTSPSHGAFAGPPRRLNRDSVAVTYVHRAADGPGHDAFTFAAQAPGTAVSVAETVDIEVAEPGPDAPVPSGAPDLAARPSELDFGVVESGSSSGLTLTLENRGSGRADGTLDPPLPWAMDGDASYRLGKGAQQTFRLVFRPRAEGAFAETLRVDAGNGAGSTSGCVVRLVGTGLPASAHGQLTTAPPTPAAMPVVADASSAAAPVIAPAVDPSASTSADAATELAGSGSAIVNEAQVTAIKVVAIDASTVELAWKPPVPLPRSYRVERRSFALDDRELGGVRVDWLPYERTDFRVRADGVTARLRGLPAGAMSTLRVVSVDTAGQLSRPSPVVSVVTAPGAGWGRPVLLGALILLLAGCVVLNAYRRRRERQRLEELDSRQVDGDASPVGKAGSYRSLL